MHTLFYYFEVFWDMPFNMVAIRIMTEDDFPDVPVSDD